MSDQEKNMYRVGDYVYFENSSSSPFAIRKIEELNRTSNGNVEAKVICYYRRSEIPASILAENGKSEHEAATADIDSDDDEGVSEHADHQNMRLREVFLSRQAESLPATLIRGKCSVTLMCEVETPASYLARDDAFYYSLVYDPQRKALTSDRGEIRIGAKYQAQVPTMDPQLIDERGAGVQDETGLTFPDLEERKWIPSSIEMSLTTQNSLSPEDLDKFIIIAKSVGTFARALDCSSSVRQPSLHYSVSAASRDITSAYAYDLIHKHNYDISEALKALVPSCGPMICKDEMEEWSSLEGELFEEAMEKYGKEFNDIRKDFLPWKSMRAIIEYFFMWKTSNRYVQHKQTKAINNEKKLKQVFVPPYSNRTTKLTGPNGEIIVRGKDCDTYPDLPRYSWHQYKKYGKYVSSNSIEDSFIVDKSPITTTAQRLAQLRPGLIIEPGSPLIHSSKGGSGKTRAAFFLRTTPMTRASRILCSDTVRLSHYARRPTKLIDMKAVKAATLAKATKLSADAIRKLNKFSKKSRSDVDTLVKKLGIEDFSVQDWLVLTPKDKIPKPEKEFFPRPPKRADGSYVYERIPPTPQAIRAAMMASNTTTDRYTGPQSQLIRKRQYDDRSSETPVKMQRTVDGVRVGPIQVIPKARVATFTRIHGGQRHVISWMDAPDDVFYKATPHVKKLRRRLPVSQIRRAARKPFKIVINLN